MLFIVKKKVTIHHEEHEAHEEFDIRVQDV